jgi:hypothetical protein
MKKAGILADAAVTPDHEVAIGTMRPRQQGVVEVESEETGLISAAGAEGLERAASGRYLSLAAIIVASALLARTLVALLFADLNPETASLWEYGGIAISSLKYGAIVAETLRPDGSVFVHPTALMPPLPVFLWMALFGALGVSKAALATAIAINIACGAAITWLTMRIAKSLFSSSLVSLIAGAFIAVNPVFVYSVATYHAVNLYLVLLLVVFDLASSRHPQTPRRAIVTGTVLGVAVLARTEDLVLGFAILLGSFWWHRRPSLAAISTLAALAVVTPWTIRNYVVFDRIIPVANSFGYNLFKGFNPQANGSGHWMDYSGVYRKSLGPQLDAVPFTINYESDIDAVYGRAAERFIADNPIAAFVGLPIRKVLLFWLFDVYDPNTHRLLYQCALWPTLILSALGFGYTLRHGLFRRPDQRTVLVLFAAQTLIMAAYAVHSRYRMNVEPFLVSYAACGVLVAIGAIRSWRSARNGVDEHRPTV